MLDFVKRLALVPSVVTRVELGVDGAGVVAADVVSDAFHLFMAGMSSSF